MTNITIAAVNDEFGPFFKYPGRQDFDFTLLFEDVILTILPSTLLLIATPFRIAHLWRTPRKVATNQLRNVKIVVSLVCWGLNAEIQTRASLAAAALSLVVALALGYLSYVEHTRCVRPSSIISAFLLLTALMDAAKVRTLWLRGESAPISSVATVALTVKLVVLMVEAKEKRDILLSPYREFPPEATSGLYSQSLFWWLNPMFALGYRSIIREIDLFPTDEDLASEQLLDKFNRQWSKRRTPARRHELIIAVVRSLFWPLAAGVFPRLCQTFFRFMQPLLIRRVTTLVSQPESQVTTYEGWGLTAAYGFVFVGVAFAAARYQHRSFRLITMVRGTLVTSIYVKSMDLAVTALDENAAVTLMSTDVQQICDSLRTIHDVYGSAIDIGLAIWLLYSEMGIAMFGPLFVTILTVSSTLLISSRTGPAQKQWVARIQTRVDITAKVLNYMKGVKLLGLTETLSDIIHRLRMTEIAKSLTTRRLTVLSILCGNSTELFAPGIAFAIFVTRAHFTGQTLNVSSAYTALSLIYLLASPIGVLAFTIPPLMAAVGCFERIQDYLLLESRRDHRLQPETYEHPSQPTETNTVKTDLNSNAIELTVLKPARPVAQEPGDRIPVLSVRNLTLTWGDVDSPVIKDVTFELSPGLTMLVGPVGSGKSSLIKGLLGEIPSSKGYIYTDTLQVAYVGQNPWIQDVTLRDNILGMSVFEQTFYSSVIHACALDQDIENLPLGDNTRVGSAGSGLSGGQKLRVALARAVYSKRRTIFLDDVFSGLDATSEDRIFSRLLGRNGLIRTLDTTILLATHAAHRLSYSDDIIALDAKGSICEHGPFSQLMKVNGYVASLAARHTTEDDETPQEDTKLNKNPILDDPAQANAVDDLTRAVGDWNIYKYYFQALGYGNTCLLFGLVGVWAFANLFPELWVKFWTSAIAVKGNRVNGAYLGVYITFECIAWVALCWMSAHIYSKMVPRSARELHGRLLNTIKIAPLSFFTSTDIGQVINRFSQDMAVIDLELPTAFFQCTASSYIAIIQAIWICLSAAYFAALMPLVLGLMYVVQRFYLRTSRQIRLMDLEAKAPLYSNFIESLSGLTTIRAFGWTKDFEQRNISLLDKSQRPYYMLFCIQRWLNLVLDLTVAGLAVTLMVLIVTLRSKLDPGLVGLALLSIMNFNLSLTQVIKNWTGLETSLGAIARVKTFVQNTTSEHLPQETGFIPAGWPFQGAINFSSVSASYTADGPSVLKTIDLCIPARQKIGLVGRSGSGKSSFITTLFHMLEITKGVITIDDIDIATLPREDLRRHLNVIPQDPLFLPGTIRMNLDPFSHAQSDDTLTSVLATVGLWTIVSNAGGLDTTMDPDNLLSHGQRQLFCLARAIVNKCQSRILILDEATASVDLQTDETMQTIIRQEFQECTIIAVAHRLGTIVDFDRVIVLDRGCVVEDGVPVELLKDESSWFKRLWDS